LLFLGRRRGGSWGREIKKKCGNVPELGKEKYTVANTYGITTLLAK